MFGNSYRETNDGKFPSTTNAMKDTGGSYYTVRQILQELIHNSKQPTGDTKETSLKKSTTRNDEVSAKIEERYEDSTSKSNGKQRQQSSVLKEASINEKVSIFQQVILISLILLYQALRLILLQFSAKTFYVVFLGLLHETPSWFVNWPISLCGLLKIKLTLPFFQKRVNDVI